MIAMKEEEKEATEGKEMKLKNVEVFLVNQIS